MLQRMNKRCEFERSKEEEDQSMYSKYGYLIMYSATSLTLTFTYLDRGVDGTLWQPERRGKYHSPLQPSEL